MYHDSKTNIELDALFMKVDTTRGIQWMFIINNADFTQRKGNYIKVVEEAYKEMLPKLQKKFNFKQQKILIDHVSNFQSLSISQLVTVRFANTKT